MKCSKELNHKKPPKAPCKAPCKDSCKDQHSKCEEDCLCKLLREFIGHTFTFRTKSGDFLEGKIECITKDCCVAIIEPEVITPHISRRVTIIRCKDIESFSKDLHT